MPKRHKRVPSLRDEHKKRTRHALRGAALKLFAAQGYDDTTTEEIAEKAGVSARTFFRYFPTKESVLFFGAANWVESFERVYGEQPDSLSDIDAVCASLIEIAPRIARGRASLRLYARAVASSPTLRGRAHDLSQGYVENVARSIAARRRLARVDEATTLLAATCILTYRRAIDLWLAGPASTRLEDAIAREFELLAEAFLPKRKPKLRAAAR